MGKVLDFIVAYDPDFPELKPAQPFRDGYVLIPYSTIQPILTWCWHDVYHCPDRLRVFLNYLLHYSKPREGSSYDHPALGGILEEMRDCRSIVEEQNAESGRWLTMQDKGDVLLPRPVLQWCLGRASPRYALGIAIVCCSQMRRAREYRFTINQSRMANRLKVSRRTILRLVSDMVEDGILEPLGRAGKAKNGMVYRWSCCNVKGTKKPEAAPDNIIRFVLPATGEKSVLRLRVRR